MENKWPKTINCENSTCGKKIDTELNSFSVVTIVGNVLKRKGAAKKETLTNLNYVLCEMCTRKFNQKFKKRNNRN